jgi:SAM-dependent methyltransferase
VRRRDILEKFGDDYVADDRTFKMGIDHRFTECMAERFVGMRVLEACTGGGFTTIALARKAAHVTTVEIDPAIRLQAQANVERAGLLDRVTFVGGDVMSEGILDGYPPIEAAFLDPDWAVAGAGHVYRFRRSNTEPPADALLERTFRLTSHVAIVLPPFVALGELEGLPTHERQELYLGDSHELYCLYFGGLARSVGTTRLRVDRER